MTPKTQIDAESASKELRYNAMERAGDILRDWVSAIQANKASSSLAVNSSVYISKSSGPTVSVLQGHRDDTRTSKSAPAQNRPVVYGTDTSTDCADLKDLYGKDIYGSFISTPISCNYTSESYFDLKNSKLYIKGAAYSNVTIEPTKVDLLTSSNSMTADAANIWAREGTKSAQFSAGTIGLWNGTNSNTLTTTASTIVTSSNSMTADAANIWAREGTKSAQFSAGTIGLWNGTNSNTLTTTASTIVTSSNSMTADAANIWAREGTKTAQFSVGTIGLNNGTSSVTIANTGSVKISTSGALTTIETPTGKPCTFREVMDGAGSKRWVLCSEVITGGTALTCADKPDATYKDVYLMNVFTDAACSTSRSYLSLKDSFLQLKDVNSNKLAFDPINGIWAIPAGAVGECANFKATEVAVYGPGGVSSTGYSKMEDTAITTKSIVGKATLSGSSLWVDWGTAGATKVLGSSIEIIKGTDTTSKCVIEPPGKATSFREVIDGAGSKRWVLCSDVITTGGTALTCATKPDATYKDLYLRNVYTDSACSASASFLSLDNSNLKLKTSSSANLWTTVDQFGVYVKTASDSTSVSATEVRIQNGVANTAIDALGLSIEKGGESTFIGALEYKSTDGTASATLLPGSLDLKGANSGQYISLGSTGTSQEIDICDSTRQIFLRTGDMTGSQIVQFRKIFDATGEERWALCSDKLTTTTTKGGTAYSTKLQAAVKAEIATVISKLGINATCNSNGTITVNFTGQPTAATPKWPTSFADTTP